MKLKFGEKSNMNFKGEDIKKIAYELYKLDWLLTHKKSLEKLKRYYTEELQARSCDETIEYPPISFAEYMNSFDEYNDECYVCYNEFLDYEYQDKEYIKELFSAAMLDDIYFDDNKEFDKIQLK